MKRLLTILLSAMLSMVIVSAGVVQFHHHHHGATSVCLCMDFGSKCHHNHSANEDNSCNESCNDSADNNCSHSLKLDDFSISKISASSPNITNLQLLAIFVSELIFTHSDTIISNAPLVERSIAIPLAVCSKELTRRGPPVKMF